MAEPLLLYLQDGVYHKRSIAGNEFHNIRAEPIEPSDLDILVDSELTLGAWHDFGHIPSEEEAKDFGDIILGLEALKYTKIVGAKYATFDDYREPKKDNFDMAQPSTMMNFSMVQVNGAENEVFYTGKVMLLNDKPKR